MGAVKSIKKDTGVGYITKGFLRDVKSELNIMGEKTRPLSAIKNLNLETLRSNFNNLLNLAREDYKETVNDDDAKLPREYFDILRRSYAEQLLSTENLAPYAGEDWSTIAQKTAISYDTKVADLVKNREKDEQARIAEKQSKEALSEVVNSDIYYDIINSIASKQTDGAGGKRFHTAKYTYLSEGSGDLNTYEFKKLISQDDLYALGQLSKVYKNNKGFTKDPLYIKIKDRVVQAGIEDLQSKKLSVTQQEPTQAFFTMDF